MLHLLTTAHKADQHLHRNNSVRWGPTDVGDSNREVSVRWRDKTYNEHAGKDGAPLVPVLNVTISQTESKACPDQSN